MTLSIVENDNVTCGNVVDAPLQTLFSGKKTSEEVDKVKRDGILADCSSSSTTSCPSACLRSLKSLPEGADMFDLKYFIAEGMEDVDDEAKFQAEQTTKEVSEGVEVRPLRARHLLGSLKSSSSDTLQCISEEDLDSKPSSSRTSMLGSSTNICSSQSSLIEKKGSLETIGSPTSSSDGLFKNVVLRKGLVSVDIPLTDEDETFRSSFHTQVLDSGEIAQTKDKVDFRSSLHLWMENQTTKPAQRAMSADPLPQDYVFLLPPSNPLAKNNAASSSHDQLLHHRPTAFNLSDNQLDRQSSRQSPSAVHYASKSGPVGPEEMKMFSSNSSSASSCALSSASANVTSPSRKASTLPRIGCYVSANVSFLHKNSTDTLLTNNPTPSTAVAAPSSVAVAASAVPQEQQQQKWSRSHQTEGTMTTTTTSNRREVRSWPAAEDNITTTASSSKSSSGGGGSGSGGGSGVGVGVAGGKTTKPKSSAVNIPQISVSDATTTEIGTPSVQSNPSGKSSMCSGQTNSDQESMPEEDIDRLVALHKTRSSLSSLGNRSDSMTSVYSAAGGGRYGTVVVRGEVLFGLNYNFKLGALEVNVAKCRDLAPVDTKRNRSDPYVKVYLLPDKSKSGKRKTKVRKHTLNPSFDEVLRFFVTISELETRTLWLTVWHSDMFGRNDFLGEVMLPLGYEVFGEDTSPKWYLLQERLGPPEEVMTYKGELMLALKYVPPDVTTQKKGKQSKGSLHVLVKEARNLTAVRANGTSDPFCKSYLLPDKSKGSKQKTAVIKKNCNPKWNHTFVYEDVSQEDLRGRCLELTVWDYDRLTSNDFLGGVRLSLGTGRYQGKDVDWLDSRGDEISLWQNMLDRPNMWIDGFVVLQPSMEKRPC